MLQDVHASVQDIATKVLRRESEVHAIKDEWKELLSRSDANEPMLSPEWLLTWWSLFGNSGGRRLNLVLLRRRDRLIGLAPILTRRNWHRSLIPIRRVEPMGAGEVEADAICSDYLSVIAESGEEQTVARKFADVVHSGGCGAWDEFVLPMMNEECAMPRLLLESFQSLGYAAEIVPMGEAPYITLPSSWEEYVRNLKKKHRYSLLRALREFEEWAGSQFAINRAVNDNLAEAKAILAQLHAERWQHERQGGRFQSSRFSAFHHAVMPLLQRQGALELLWLCVRGEPLAAQYNIVWNNKVYFYQCGRRMNLPDRVRPGQVLLAHTIQSAIQAGRREFDFLNGAAPYKLQLATSVHPLVGIRVARSCLAEYLRGWTECTVKQIRKVRHRWRSLWSARKS
jgi:CelD/BcsL family acetyltransferase involved in cellulose biosynthesis